MHIAICDDNVADRKQLERLLKRESDRRATEDGILYTDSFGNCTSLLNNPRQYDVFYIDMCKTEGVCGTDLTNQLLEMGIQAPIVLCCSDIDYKKETFPENVLFLEKPIRTEELTKSIDVALSHKKNALPLIELREEKDTFYVTESDILYCIAKGRFVDVTLSDGRLVHLATDLVNFFTQIEHYPVFFAPNNKTILNGRHITSIAKKKATMDNGSTFKIHPKCLEYAEQIFAEYH